MQHSSAHGLAAKLPWWVHGQLSNDSWLHLQRVLVEVAARIVIVQPCLLLLMFSMDAFAAARCSAYEVAGRVMLRQMEARGGKRSVVCGRIQQCTTCAGLWTPGGPAYVVVSIAARVTSVAPAMRNAMRHCTYCTLCCVDVQIAVAR